MPVLSLDIDRLTLLGAADEHFFLLAIDEPAPPGDGDNLTPSLLHSTDASMSPLHTFSLLHENDPAPLSPAGFWDLGPEFQRLDDKIAALERSDLGSELLRLEAQVSGLERRVEVYKKDPDQDMRADREAIMRCREDIRAYGGYLDAPSKDLRACSKEIERLRMVTSDS